MRLKCRLEPSQEPSFRRVRSWPQIERRDELHRLRGQMTALHLESLPFRKNERMFEEKSSGTAKGFVMTDLHRTRRRSIRIGRGTGRAIIRIFLATTLTWCAGTV